MSILLVVDLCLSAIAFCSGAAYFAHLARAEKKRREYNELLALEVLSLGRRINHIENRMG